MIIGSYTAQYIGKTMCGFKNSYEYRIEVTKDIYGYQVTGITNLTGESGSSAYITYASEKSFRKNWIIKEGEENWESD